MKRKKQSVKNNFNKGINAAWNQLTTGGGILGLNNSILKLGFKKASTRHYADAQLDDYTMLPRSKFPWKAPLKMTIKARFSSDKIEHFQGTAGFGFWNNPFSVYGGIYTLPESIWFFFSSSVSDMPLKRGSRGYGWKAQAIHAMKLSNFIYFIPTSLAILISKLLGDMKYSQYWIEKFSGVKEKEIDVDIKRWHIYEIEWEKNKAKFSLDGKIIMRCSNLPSQPLGFVAWVDNQYAIISPKNIIKFGTIDSGGLFLEIKSIKINTL